MSTAITNPNIPVVPRGLRSHRYLNIGFVAELVNLEGWRRQHCGTFQVDMEDWDNWDIPAYFALDMLCTGTIKHARIIDWFSWSK